MDAPLLQPILLKKQCLVLFILAPLVSSIAATGKLTIHVVYDMPKRTKLPVTVLLQMDSLTLVAMSGVTLGKGRRKLEIFLVLPRGLN